jgi:hypothetical protein
MTTHCRQLEQANEALEQRLEQMKDLTERCKADPGSPAEKHSEESRRHVSMLQAEATERMVELEMENKALRRELDQNEFARSPRQDIVPETATAGKPVVVVICFSSDVYFC